jgi:hypothetical protein
MTVVSDNASWFHGARLSLFTACSRIAQLCMLMCASAWPTASTASPLSGDLGHGASLFERDGNGLTPLHLALKSEQRETAIELIHRGADINARTPFGLTPLSLAIEKGYIDVIDLLLERNAVVESPSLEPGPLFAAMHAGNLEVFERLVARGAQANRLNSEGVSLLYEASSSGKEAFAARLLALGADINFALPDGRTSLHAAVGNLHDGVARLLLAHGAAVVPAEGEVGVFTTALVYRFVAQNEYEKRDAARASEFLERARLSFLATRSVVDRQAGEFSGNWPSPDFHDTEVRWDDDLGGVRWEGVYLRGSSSRRP